MDSVQGDRCPALIINLEGFILAARCCAVKNMERAEASAWGVGKRRDASPKRSSLFSRDFTLI